MAATVGACSGGHTSAPALAGVASSDPGQSAPSATATVRPAIPEGLDLYLPVPDDNPLTPAKVELGRRLFFDPILSRDRTIACASCHVPEKAFTDGRPISMGVFGRMGSRHVPTIINRAYGVNFFWDGRAESLELQVLRSMENPKEMDLSADEAVRRLSASSMYRGSFRRVFRRPVSADHLTAAVASFMRTILSGDALIDAYVRGDSAALSASARRGLELFRGRANCTACHAGPTFTDERFHNTGIAWNNGRLTDPGRFTVTGEESDRGVFKTPTLRDVARTAPYMHDGSFPSLDAVIDHYDRGGRANPFLDEELRPLRLTEREKSDLLAFLHSLTGKLQWGFADRPLGPDRP